MLPRELAEESSGLLADMAAYVQRVRLNPILFSQLRRSTSVKLLHTLPGGLGVHSRPTGLI